MSNIILLGLTSLFADFSSEIIVPLLPIFISTLGGAGLAIGLISGVGDATASILKVVSGRWVDKNKKYKRFVLWGYAFSAIAKFFFPLATTWQHILIARPIERLGKGFRNAPRDAIVSESVSLEKRGAGFGLQRMMDSLGAILGSVTVLILVWKFGFSFKLIFLLAAFVSLLSVIPIFFIKEPVSLKTRPSRFQKSGVGEKFSPLLKKFIVISTVFSLGNFSFMFLILKAQTFLSATFSNGLVLTLLLYIFFNVFDTIFSRPAGKLSDKIGRKKVILTAYFLLSLTFAGFLLASSFWVFLFLFPIYGLFKAFIDASQKAFVSDLSPVEIRGSALGTFEASTGLALIPGGIIAGLLWNANPNLLFAYGLTISFSALVLLQVTVKNSSLKN
ncbi:MAG: MFS transporter [Candidatus Yanofskybacteria bacterium]|nr:MFS transporter [Candidatus Yanofskybacteria bacterium]